MRIIRINTDRGTMVDQYRNNHKYSKDDPFVLIDDKTRIQYGPFMFTTTIKHRGCFNCPVDKCTRNTSDRHSVCFLSGCTNTAGTVIHIDDLLEDI